MEGDEHENQGVREPVESGVETGAEVQAVAGEVLVREENRDQDQKLADAGALADILVDPRAKELEHAIVMRWYLSYSEKEIAKHFKLSDQIVKDCIRLAPDALHKLCASKAECMPGAARGRLRSFLLLATETVREILTNPDERAASRLRASEMVFASQGIKTQYGGEPKITVERQQNLIVSKGELVQMLKGAVASGLATEEDVGGGK